MTLHDFAIQITTDPAYRATLAARAQAGSLPMEIELFLLEISADLRPLVPTPARVPPQSPTLALIRPAVANEEVVP